MKKITILFKLLALCAFIPIQAQEFEATNLDDITNTPSASRSANFVDVNGDGWDDIYFSNGPYGSQNNMLYINNQDGTFTTVTNDDIVLDDSRSDGASFADADNDGDVDMFMVTYGFGGSGNLNYFYRNNGDGSFDYEVGAAMGLVYTYSEMATWVDVNNDQNLDIYFTNSYLNLNNQYFENQGDETFDEVVDLIITNDALASRSVDWIDYDNDGDDDIFITNENNQENSLFRNDGPNNFIQIFDSEITQSNRNSAGSSWADIDNDGDFDLLVANWNGQNNQLFINNNGSFTEQVNSVIANGGGSSFGSTFGDIDNDGDLDLFVCNSYFTGQTKNFVYLNNGNGNFTQDVSSDLANHEGYTFGAAFGDYDNDGWLDLILANTFDEDQSNSLYRNTGAGNNWVKILCKGTQSNASAIGATLSVKATINGQEVVQTRKIAANSGYCSQNSYTNHFGLADAVEIEEITVHWPSGAIETFTDQTVNGFYTIVEGEGISLQAPSFSEETRIDIFPNPVENVFAIKASNLIGISNLELQVYSMQGSLIIKKDNLLVNNNNFQKTINMSHLNPGVYMYRLNDGTSTLKIGRILKN